MQSPPGDKGENRSVTIATTEREAEHATVYAPITQNLGAAMYQGSVSNHLTKPSQF